MLLLAGLLQGLSATQVASSLAGVSIPEPLTPRALVGAWIFFGMAYATDRRHCHWSGGKVRSRDPLCASPLGGDRLGRRALGDRFRRLPCFDGSERGASALPVLGLVEARSSRKGSLKLIKVSGYMAHKNGVCNCHNELLDRE